MGQKISSENYNLDGIQLVKKKSLQDLKAKRKKSCASLNDKSDNNSLKSLKNGKEHLFVYHN